MMSRVSRRTVFLTSIFATAISFFTLGITGARRGEAAAQASYEATLAAIRSRSEKQLGKGRDDAWPGRDRRISCRQDLRLGSRRDGRHNQGGAEERDGARPLQLLRDRRSSFVELYSYDNFGKTNYGTAGYLGGGYFITVKHAVVALPQDDGGSDGRKIVSVKVVYRGKEIAAKVVDTGDADAEVHSGDWAIIKTAELDLPALQTPTQRMRTTSRIRSSGWATTTPRASFSPAVTWASGPQTGWSPV